MLTAYTLIGGFNVFDIVFIMTKGGPANATEVLATYTYTMAFRQSQVGYGATLTLVITVLSMVASYFFITMRERGQAEHALASSANGANLHDHASCTPKATPDQTDLDEGAHLPDPDRDRSLRLDSAVLDLFDGVEDPHRDIDDAVGPTAESDARKLLAMPGYRGVWESISATASSSRFQL